MAAAPLDVALAYFDAWSRRDLDAAMAYIDPDIVCDAPPGRLVGADAYRTFLGAYVGMLVSASVIAAFGDEERALVMYDSATRPVADAPGAECLTVVDGRITHSRFIFDRAPFDAARAAAAAAG
ncbi:nuclear transport factor 2 family protein [Cellulomonas sp. P5_C6]